MAGYTCKQLSDDDVVKIEGLFAVNPIVFHRNNLFMGAATFVQTYGNRNGDGQSLEQLLVKLVSDNVRTSNKNALPLPERTADNVSGKDAVSYCCYHCRSTFTIVA